MKRVGFRWTGRGSCRHPEAMTIRGGSLCPVDFPALVGLIEHPARGVFLFDTGYDPAFLTATKPFPERIYRWTTPVDIGPDADWQTWLSAHGIAQNDLAGTIVSHFHGDHVSGLKRLAHLPVWCARAGLKDLRQAGRIGRVRKGYLSDCVPLHMTTHFFEDAREIALPSAFAPFTSGRDMLGDGSLLAVELPGHCPGHWGLAFRTEDGRDVLLAADAVWTGKSIRESRPPPRITTALLGDTRSYRATLDLLCQAARNNTDLAILPSHCATSAEAFRGDDAD